MNDTTMTIVGNLVDEPKLRLTKNQHAVTSFRVASTSRRYNRELGCFVDDTTLFVNVTCWRALAENAHQSLHKGQPVVVSGRYYQREYEANETKHIRYELEANAIGHDLTRGTSDFSKTFRPSATGLVEADASGAPADDSDAYFANFEREAYSSFDTADLADPGDAFAREKELAPAG